jgi:parvulin-like peptidyl-prolyl isomerase
MERKVIISAIITVIAGGLLTAGNPAFSLEGGAVKTDNQGAVSGKVAGSEATADKTVKEEQFSPSDPEKKGKDEQKFPEGTVSVNLKIPFFSPLFTDVPLASVADQVITVQELGNAVAAVHEKMTKEKETQAKKSFLETLQRLINAKLVVLEARNIELDKLPEIRSEVDKNAEMQLRQTLFLDHVKDLKADEKEVDRVYKEMIKEWKLNSVLFKKQDDAKAFESEIKAGKGFDELRVKAIKDGKGEQAGQNEESYANAASLGPVLGEAVAGLKVGSVSPIVSMQNAFVIVKVLDVRSVEDPETKEKARSQVLSQMRLESLKKFKDDLYKKYVKQDTKLIKSIDFEAAKPGLAKLLKDKRSIVTIKGEKPITVSELSEAVRDKYYHG